jgi:hypothetical protein
MLMGLGITAKRKYFRSDLLEFTLIVISAQILAIETLSKVKKLGCCACPHLKFRYFYVGTPVWDFRFNLLVGLTMLVNQPPLKSLIMLLPKLQVVLGINFLLALVNIDITQTAV